MSASRKPSKLSVGWIRFRHSSTNCCVKSPALHGARIILLNVCHSAIERGLVGILQQHRNSRICEHHCDSAAHRSGADDGRFIYGNQWRLFRNIRNLRHFTLAEENVNQSLGLVGEEAFDEEFLLLLAALLERQFCRSFHRINRRQGAINPRCFVRAVSRAAAKIGAFSSSRSQLFVCVLASWAQALPQSRAQKQPRPQANRLRSTGRQFRASTRPAPSPVFLRRTSPQPSRHPPSRGKRCVPAAPGIMPSFTSGCPTCASGAATR